MIQASPFPGMDPWLERHWGDVHQAIVTYARDQIQERLPAGLLARMQDGVSVEYVIDSRKVFPDIRVVEYATSTEGPEPRDHGNVAVAEPLLVRLQSEPAIESFIEIIDASSGKLVTVIEVLSPANKLPGKGQEQYLQKQRELAQAGVSLVEIDLLRTGQRMTNAPPELLPQSHRTAYQACVRRASRCGFAEAYRIPLRQKLPTIRIPLRPQDEDAVLDLQALLEEVYRKGRYAMSIDYKLEPYPPLLSDDALWANEVLRTGGMR